MKVHQLKSMLAQMPDDDEVYIETDGNGAMNLRQVDHQTRQEMEDRCGIINDEDTATYVVLLSPFAK